MQIPEGVVIRREHKLTAEQVKKLKDWLEMKSIARKRMRDAHRRFQESDAIFTGILAEMKWELGWASADNVIFDSEEGKMLDLVPGVDQDGNCLSCGEKHDPEDEH